MFDHKAFRKRRQAYTEQDGMTVSRFLALVYAKGGDALISRQTLDQWEKGRQSPRHNWLVAACGVLGCTLDDVSKPTAEGVTS